MWKDQFLQYLKGSTLAESHFEKAIALKRQHLPKRIYKYRRDDEYARKNLKDNTIWLASPDSYNDPYDCLLRFSAPSMISAFERGFIDPFVTGYQLNISAEEIDEARKSATPLQTLSQIISRAGKPGANAKKMAEFIAQVVPKYVESTVEVLQAVRLIMKVCSFSAVSDAILMWSHYGHYHQGFCIEYDLEQFNPDDAFLKNLYPVIYSHELFDLTSWAEKLVTGKREEFTTLTPLLAVLQKFEGWEYEQEWRYVSFQETPPPNRARPMPLPSRILLGAKMPPTSQQELLAICTEKNIPVWQMRMAPDKYELLAGAIAAHEPFLHPPEYS